MKYYYITEERCYAGEFDTFGFVFMTEEEFKKNKQNADKILDSYFTKFSQKEFLKRQEEFNQLKISQGFEYDFQVVNIENPLPYMYGGYGDNKKFDSQYNAPYSEYLKLWGTYRGLELERSFGTNESHIITSKEDFWESINVKEISKEEYDITSNVVGKSGGIMCFPLY